MKLIKCIALVSICSIHAGSTTQYYPTLEISFFIKHGDITKNITVDNKETTSITLDRNSVNELIRKSDGSFFSTHSIDIKNCIEK